MFFDSGNHGRADAGWRRLYPFASRYAEVNGRQYHYIDEGAGDPVVMVHGNPTWSFYFRELVKALSPEFRAVAMDHIGCGLSEKPGPAAYDYRLASRIRDLEIFLEQIGVTDNITLVVHDWGGMIGMAYAVRHPKRIRRLVVMNTAAFFPCAWKGLPLRLRMVRNLKPFAGPAVLGLNLFARGAVYMASKKGLPRDVRTGLLAPYDSWENRIATLRFVQDIPVRPGDPGYDIVQETADGLGKLAHVPMLICWGKRDFVFTMTFLEEWRRRFPKAEVHLFEDAGHYVLEDAVGEVVPLVRNFLRRK